jgi:curved DNA-binding protein CbpA
VQGRLGEKLVADLIREIAQKNQSGLLRLTRGRSIKAMFFDSGKPVFAISNLLNEQFDQKLVKDGLATAEQIEQAKARAGKANRIGTALIEMGVLSDAIMRKLVRQQVMEIILSVFEWTDGDYVFDERIRAAHEVTINMSAVDVLLEGARHAAGIGPCADLIAPQDGVVVRASQNGSNVDSGRLMPVESYVLSRIESPTAVSEVGALSGIADADAHRAVCALIAAGFLRLLDKSKQQEEEAERDDGEDLDRLRKEISRKIHFYSSADYYEVLGIGRQATTGEIKSAYYQLAKRFHPDRYRRPDQSDIRHRLEALFTFITQAYETLGDPAQRANYDDRLRKSPSTATPAAPVLTPSPASLKTKPLTMADLPAAEPAQKSQERNPSDDLKTSGPLVKASGPLEQPQHAAIISQPQSTPQQNNSGVPPAQQAEHCYQQGRARFDRKEYHLAVHLLREAVKLDPSRAPYHFHLGLALIRNPRTRREAIEHLTKAAELEPYNAQIRVKMGMLYKEAGLPKKAEAYFRQALSLDPENRAAKRELDSSTTKGKSASIWKSDFGSIAKRLFKK